MVLGPAFFALLQLAACDTAASTRLAQEARRAAGQRNYDAAAVAFQRAFEACPRQRRLLLEAAQALTSVRKFVEVKRVLTDFLAAEPNSEPALVLLANAHFMVQEFADALKTADRALKVNPKAIPALTIKANAHYVAGEEQQAVAAFQKASDLDPKNEDLHYSLGRIFYQQNRFDQAIAKFKKVLELNPKSHKAWDNLGLCYEALNKDDEAAKHYLKALDLVYKDHSEYDWAYANFANLLLKRGEYQKAFQLAAEAAQRNPNSARNFYLTGKALARLNKNDAAVKWLKRSTELDPTYPEPHYLLGQIYAKQGLKAESDSAFKKFEEISAKTPRVRR